jgi:3-phosphoshikimate 1-carboxyvinyltransferase
MRLMTGILAGRGLPSVLIGDASLSRRPMGRVCEPLRQLGAHVHGRMTSDAKARELPPLSIGTAALRGGVVDSAVASAQVKSALLLAGLAAGVPVTVSEPYLSRDHTERMLRAMGVAIDGRAHEGRQHITLTPGVLRPCDFVAPGDVSSAAFLLAAGTIIPGSKVTVQEVGLNGTRTGVLEIFEEYGAGPQESSWREVGGEPLGDVTAAYAALSAVQHGDQPTKVAGDVIPRLIDELVVLAAVASQAQGTTVIADAEELRVKESDRVDETARLLAAFGVTVQTAPDGLTVRGPQPLRPATVDVSSDHRIALTGAVLALAAPGASVLRGFEVAAVSFPDFPQVLQGLGAKLRVVD